MRTVQSGSRFGTRGDNHEHSLERGSPRVIGPIEY